MTVYSRKRSLYFPTAQVLPTWNAGDLRVVMRDRGHTLVQFRVDDSPASVRYASGSPIEVYWDMAPNNGYTVYAYASHADPQPPPKGSKRLLTRVNAWGATYWLKQANHRQWTDVGLRTVFQDVVGRHRLSLVMPTGPKSNVVIPSVTQDGCSDWAFLVEMCEQYGLSMLNEGATVIVLDRGFVLEQSLTLGRRVRTAVLLEPLRASYGATPNAGPGTARRKAYGVDARTSRVYEVHPTERVTGSFGTSPVDVLFDEYVSHTALSEEMALAELNGHDDDTRWSQMAQVRADGDPRLRPGTIIRLGGVDDAQRGLWYLLEADHRLRSGYPYEVHLTMGRDARGWDDHTSLAASQPTTLPDVRLTQRRWTSATEVAT